MKKATCLIIHAMAVLFFMTSVMGPAAGGDNRQRQTVRIAYTDWASSVASANLIKAVFQESLKIRCDLVRMSADEMWQAVADGDVDAMLSAWLPDTHAHYLEEFADRLIDLGPNLSGTRTGLVVPDVKLGRLAAGTGIRKSYITIDAITEMKAHADRFRRRIVGVEPEAGIMRQTIEAMAVYGLEDFGLIKGSEVEMIDALSRAIHQQQWIVVTGWVPHWSFARWNLRFLDDPKTVYGEEGQIHTIARIGLDKKMPGAFALLDSFHWAPEEVEQLMLWIKDDDGRFPYDKAIRWIRVNPDRVEAWTNTESNVKPRR